MSLLSYAPLGLALVGIGKAAAVIWLGPKVGVPASVVSLAAALWVTGPATVAWLVTHRRAARAKTGAAARA